MDPSSIYYSDTTIESTTTVHVPPPTNTSTTITTVCFNETVTSTIFLSIISTDWSTTTCTETETETETSTTTDTTTDTIVLTKTDTTTDTTTITVPTTITEAPNPCPTTCSMSAGTVNLFYWPTNQPQHIYPSTYVNSHLNYTFTSPSVYMVVDTLYGYNTAGRAGPSGTSVVFPLDLDQVSTIDLTNSATRQLTLNDLGTDCPQTEAPSAIATAKPNGRCDPILVAPEPVKSWASPCNACGNFGLFDPPYAVSPLTGGLVPVTTTVAMTQPETQTTPSAISVDTTATPVETSTMAVSTEATSSQVESSSSSVMSSPVSSSSVPVTTGSASSSSVSSPATTTATFNPASKLSGPGGLLGLSLMAVACLM
ncbi:hypothetical protein PENSUB_4985 [Penicillium subrubescens]|uniref:Uncharacterized protein n=2 Tax=Penicillium subrubescens TaxID=1316194 RepID=A0A1Q5UB63_9EURO|nr:hypothetical protein PENSUB_4985 [Penicillium subrubescens]